MQILQETAVLLEKRHLVVVLDVWKSKSAASSIRCEMEKHSFHFNEMLLSEESMVHAAPPPGLWSLLSYLSFFPIDSHSAQSTTIRGGIKMRRPLSNLVPVRHQQRS